MPGDDEAFCSNPRCLLHCSPAHPQVAGRGEWATLANGRTYARLRRNGRHYCHVCARDPEHAPGVRLSDPGDDRSNDRGGPSSG